MGHSQWTEEALNAIRLNMKDQHTEMKRQLQERHKDIANHIGQDVSGWKMPIHIIANRLNSIFLHRLPIPKIH